MWKNEIHPFMELSLPPFSFYDHFLMKDLYNFFKIIALKTKFFLK